MTCESCSEKDKIISELNKRINQLEEQTKEIKSYIWKLNKHKDEPKKTGPPVGHEPHNRPAPENVHRKVRLNLSSCPDCGGRLSSPVRARISLTMEWKLSGRTYGR